MKNSTLKLTVAAAVSAALAFSAAAADQQQNRGDTQMQEQKQRAQGKQKQQKSTSQARQQSDAAAVVAITDWEYDPLYEEGWTADAIIGAEVFGRDNNEIGNVENLLINEKGQIVAVVAEVGGFWDIGDTHVAVPWNQVSVDADWHVNVPVTEESVDDYSLYKDEYYTKVDVGSKQEVSDELGTGPQIWKATDLLDDYALLENGDTYGYVTDLVFDTDGQLLSVVANPSAGYGWTYGDYAYPWYANGWSPTSTYYTVPYTAREIGGLTAFNYDYVNDVW